MTGVQTCALPISYGKIDAEMLEILLLSFTKRTPWCAIDDDVTCTGHNELPYFPRIFQLEYSTVVSASAMCFCFFVTWYMIGLYVAASLF